MRSRNKKTVDVNRSFIRVRKREIYSEPKSNTIDFNNHLNNKLLSISTNTKNISIDKLTSVKKNYILIEDNDNTSCYDYHTIKKNEKTYIKSLRDKIFNKVILDFISHLKKYIKSFYIKVKLFHFFFYQLKFPKKEKKKYNAKFIYRKLNKPFEYINNKILTTSKIEKPDNNRVFDISKIYFLENKISSINQANNTLNYSSIRNSDTKEIYHKKFISNNSTHRHKSESRDRKGLSTIRRKKNPLNLIQFRNYLTNINRVKTPQKLNKKKLHANIMLYQKKNYVAKQKTEKLLLDSYDGYINFSDRSSSKKKKNINNSNFINYYNNITNHKNKIQENSSGLMFFLKMDSFICHISNILRKYKNIYVKYFLMQLKSLKNKKSKISIDKVNYISNKNININIIKTRYNNKIYEKLSYKSKKNNQKFKKITSGRLLFDVKEGYKMKNERYKNLYIQNITKFFIGNDMELIKKWFDLWRNNTKKNLYNGYFYRKNFYSKNNSLMISVKKSDKKEDLIDKIHYFKILLIGYTFALKKNSNTDNNNSLL